MTRFTGLRLRPNDTGLGRQDAVPVRMARPLRVLSLLSRLGALSVAAASSCRFASRGAGGAWTGQSHVRRDRAPNRPSAYSHEMPEEDGVLDVEDVEDKIQALVDESRRKQKTVKYHMLRRQMTPPGAPQRKLTWDAIEQIRYLKQEEPEEWTVERLAEGFSVTPDVITRVLRSKFVPAPETRARQNAKVMAGVSPQVLPSGAGEGQSRLKLPGNRRPAALPSGSRDGALIPVADQTLMIRGEGSAAPAPVTVLPTSLTAAISKAATVTDSPTSTNPLEDAEEEETWDGQVLTEEQLEEFMNVEQPAPIVQVGNDFFDAEGNFLYRI